MCFANITLSQTMSLAGVAGCKLPQIQLRKAEAVTLVFTLIVASRSRKYYTMSPEQGFFSCNLIHKRKSIYEDITTISSKKLQQDYFPNFLHFIDKIVN